MDVSIDRCIHPYIYHKDYCDDLGRTGYKHVKELLHGQYRSAARKMSDR